MPHVGLDLSRQRVEVCLISSEGELVEHFSSPVDRDGHTPTRRVAVLRGANLCGVVDSMNGARFMHDELVKYSGGRCWSPTRSGSRVRRRWRARPSGGYPQQHRATA